MLPPVAAVRACSPRTSSAAAAAGSDEEHEDAEECGDLFIPVLSAKVCDYGAKTVSERTTRHPTPAHVTLAVVLQVRNGALQALLWQRAREPFKGRWSLPGGYLAEHDTLEESIRRHLAEKVDVRELSHLEQLETLSDPKRSPKEWQLATAYLGLVPSDVDPALPGDTDWHPVDDLPAARVRP